MTNVDVAELLEELAKKDPLTLRRALEGILALDRSLFEKCVPQIIDPQTGFYNQTHFEHVLMPKAVEIAKETRTPLSYAIFDLDDFHNFNVAYGMQRGNDAINVFTAIVDTNPAMSALGNLIRNNVRSSRRHLNLHGNEKRHSDSYDIAGTIVGSGTVAGRIGGGEEFGLLMLGTDENTAYVPINRIKDAVSNIKIPFGNGNVGITTSVGIAEYNPRMAIDELRRNAEVAMRFSKYLGKGTVTAYSKVPEGYSPTLQRR